MKVIKITRKKLIKNIIKYTILSVISVVLLILSVRFLVRMYDIARCERLTQKYGYEFKDEYKQCSMLPEEIEYFKVLDYEEEYAEVYYVTKDYGSANLLKFSKEENKWVMTSWDTIWSKYGSADGYIWPYRRYK